MVDPKTSEVSTTRSIIPMLVLFLWMFLVNTPSLQLLFPLYSTLYLRELATVLLLIFFVLGRRSQVFNTKIFVIFFAISLFTFVTVARSQSFSLAIQFKMLLRFLLYPLCIIVVPKFIRKDADVRTVFMVVLIINVVLALTAPLQDIIGVIPQLYAYEDLAFSTGRGGFARYHSMLGDPNVGGMIGGLFPLILLIEWPDGKHRRFFWQMIVWGISFLLVAYSQSMTAIFLLLFSILIIGFHNSKPRYRKPLFLLLLLILAFIAIPDSWGRISGVFDTFSSFRGHLVAAPGIIPHSNWFLTNLDYRLFAFLDVNDTLQKILFGSTFDVAGFGGDYNPRAIMAHNAYKEFYIVGGLVLLWIFMILFGFTAWRGYRLMRHRTLLPDSLQGVAKAVTLIVWLLLAVMFTFPIYFYPGIGLLFWVSVSLVHVIYDRYLVSSLPRKSFV